MGEGCAISSLAKVHELSVKRRQPSVHKSDSKVGTKKSLTWDARVKVSGT